MAEKNTKEKKMYQEIHKFYHLDKYFKDIENNTQGSKKGSCCTLRSSVNYVIRRAYRSHFGSNVRWNDLSRLDQDTFIYIILWNNATFNYHVLTTVHTLEYEEIEKEVAKKIALMSVDYANQTVDYIYYPFHLNQTTNPDSILGEYEKFKNYLQRYNDQYSRAIPVPCISQENWLCIVANKEYTVKDYVDDYDNHWDNLFEKYIQLLSITQFVIADQMTMNDVRTLIEQRTGSQFIDKFDAIWNVVQKLGSKNYDSVKLALEVSKELALIFPYEYEIYNIKKDRQYYVTDEEIDHIAVRVLIKVLSDQLHIKINREEIRKTLKNIKEYHAANNLELELDSESDKTYLHEKMKLENLEFYEVQKTDEKSLAKGTTLSTDWFELLDYISDLGKDED